MQLKTKCIANRRHCKPPEKTSQQQICIIQNGQQAFYLQGAEGVPKTQKILLKICRKFAGSKVCHYAMPPLEGETENFNTGAQLHSLTYAATLKVCLKLYAIYWF